MRPRWKGYNILVADPSDVTRSTLKHHLECQGAIVYTASVVDKLKTIIEGTDQSRMPINLIVIDLNLPETTGLMSLKIIQAALGGRKIPILVVSNGFSGLLVKQMKDYGAFGYLRKPFKIDTLDKFMDDRVTAFDKAFLEPATNNQSALKIIGIKAVAV